MTNEIYHTYKFRLYPTQKQKAFLCVQFGCCRFVYNYFLDKQNTTYNESPTGNFHYPGWHDNCSELTLLKAKKEYEWLSHGSSSALQASLMQLNKAFVGFFEKKTGLPTFRKKSDRQLIDIAGFKCENGRLKIPKLKTTVKFNAHRKIEGEAKSTMISLSRSGQYYLILRTKQLSKPGVVTQREIGLDFGLEYLAVDSNGVRYTNLKLYRKAESHLKYLQRQMSHRQRGSGNRNRTRIKLARASEKVTKVRLDYLHKLTTKWVNENQVICIESLNVKEMMKTPWFSKDIRDACWGTMASQLKYKCLRNERNLVRIDRWYPSSKNCNVCNWIYQDLKQTEYVWTCPKCGTVHDRDINAAKNILKQGLNMLRGSGAESSKNTWSRWRYSRGYEA